MPLVRIDVLAGRSPELLERLIANVSATVSDTLDTPIDRVRVVINEVPPHLWGIGGVPASRVPGRAPVAAPEVDSIASPAPTRPAAPADPAGLPGADRVPEESR